MIINQLAGSGGDALPQFFRRRKMGKLVGKRTFVVLGDPGDPDIPLAYQIDGESLTFDALMPDRCSSATCRDQFAFAVSQYAVGTWQRVDP